MAENTLKSLYRTINKLSSHFSQSLLCLNVKLTPVKGSRGRFYNKLATKRNIIQAAFHKICSVDLKIH